MSLNIFNIHIHIVKMNVLRTLDFHLNFQAAEKVLRVSNLT